MTRRPRLAIVGAGWIVEHAYVPALSARPVFDVVAVHDVRPDRASRIASQLGAEADGSAERCLAPDVDAVLVCLPPQQHADLVPRLLACGKFVLCEKPVCRSSAEADALGPTAGRLLMGSAASRLRDDVSTLVGWVRSGLVGTPTRICAGWLRGSGVPAPGTWRTDPETSPGGVLDDLGPHLLDIVCALVPEVDTEHPWRATDVDLERRAGGTGGAAAWFEGGVDVRQDPVCVSARATLTSPAGVRVELALSWDDGGEGDETYVVCEGTRGVGEYRGLLGFSPRCRTRHPVCRLRRVGMPDLERPSATGPERQLEGFAASVARFARFCCGAEAPAASAADVRRVARWLEDIRRSADCRATARERATEGLLDREARGAGSSAGPR